MKSRHSMILATVFAVIALAGTATAQNILTNGDFETGDLSGWVVAGGNASATVTVEMGDNGPTLPGNNYAYLSNFGEAIGLTLKQTTAVGSISDGELTYGFDLKLDQADIGGVVFVEVFAEQSGVGIVGSSGLMGPFWPWNAWESYTGSFIAPVGADFATIQITAVTGAAVGTSCVLRADNVSLEQEGSVASDVTTWSQIKAQYR